jgi:protein phosphatase
MTLTLPEFSLVLLVGPSGSGKSTFGRRHFRPTEVVASDFCRGLVADDENDMGATDDAFELLHHIVAKRLEAGRLTVVDATNVQAASRRPLLALAKKFHCQPVAIVFDLPETVCLERNRLRTDRTISGQATQRQLARLHEAIGDLGKEGFDGIYRFRSVEEVDAASVVRERLPPDLSAEVGPFDIIGDVHGCYDELTALLARLGHAMQPPPDSDRGAVPAPVERGGRTIVYLGDLVDRGPKSVEVLRGVMRMAETGRALCVPGNHDMKLLRVLNGRKVALSDDLAETMAQMASEPPEFVERVRAFLGGLVSHYVLDGRRLVVAHAGMKREMQGRVSERIRSFALYGETTGETDAWGLPVRVNWAEEYRGRAMVVYGHTPVREPQWAHHTINIDTGCVFGGRLTALRYPECELVSVPAARAYYAAATPA